MAKKLEVGAKAPMFRLPSDSGDEISLKSFSGKFVVLYFYPKDDTTGCTKEAIEFTGLAEKFRKADAVVLGVSKDDVKSHEKFVNKYNLDVRLLSDVDGSLCRSYGVWVEKNMYGRKYMGIERSTFLVDKKGLVRELWRKVKVGGHAQSVLDVVLRENN